MRIWPFRRNPVSYIVFVRRDGEHLVINHPGDVPSAERWRAGVMSVADTRIVLGQYTLDIVPAEILTSFCLDRRRPGRPARFLHQLGEGSAAGTDLQLPGYVR